MPPFPKLTKGCHIRALGSDRLHQLLAFAQQVSDRPPRGNGFRRVVAVLQRIPIAGGAPLPAAPPCILQRRFPRTAGDRHGFPLRVRAPHRDAWLVCDGLWRMGLFLAFRRHPTPLDGADDRLSSGMDVDVFNRDSSAAPFRDSVAKPLTASCTSVAASLRDCRRCPAAG